MYVHRVPNDQGDFRHLNTPFERDSEGIRLPASDPGKCELPGFLLLFRDLSMRTYDKLIATIPARRSVEHVRLRFGASPQADLAWRLAVADQAP